MAAEWFPDAELVPTEGLVEELRRVKDDGEVARIGGGRAIADDALADVRPLLRDGLTEAEFALDARLRDAPAAAPSGASFETIVAVGPNGAKPHARPVDPAHRARASWSCSTSAPWSTATART